MKNKYSVTTSGNSPRPEINHENASYHGAPYENGFPGKAADPVVGNHTSQQDQSDKEKKKDKEKPKQVGLFELFRFADAKDKLLMVIGSIAAIGNGAAMPVLIIVFGDMSNSLINDAFFKNFLDQVYANITLFYNNTYSYDELLTDPDLLARVAVEMNMTEAWSGIAGELGGSILDEMSGFAVYFAIIGVAVIVLGYIAITCWGVACYRQSQRIRLSLFQAVLKQEIGWFDTHEVGEINNRLADDVCKIQEGIGDKLGMFISYLSTFLVGFVIGFIYGWELTLVILAIAPIIAVVMGAVGKVVSTLTNKELAAYAKAGAVAEEVFAAIRTVTAFGGQEKECNRYNSNLASAMTHGARKGTVNGIAFGLFFLVMFGSYALAFWAGSRFFLDRNYTAGDILIVFFCIMIGAFSMGSTGTNVSALATARGAAYSVYEIIDNKPSIDSSSSDGEQPNLIEGNITFRDVVFKYPSRPDVQILNGLNLKVSVGQTVALVGPSGCGKSTTVQLIQRFYDPQEGAILLDSTNIRDLNVKWLRQQIGVVSQEPVLFATTIEENIRYGRDGISLADIEEAAIEANAHNFIMELPEKYQTLVGERGAQLSGGQKQRIAIARALVRNPKILLLDEATSALDTESESIVQAALDQVRKGRTTIVIAHRLSTVQNADIICGIENGNVVEQGSHDELMRQGGIYHTLVSNQTSEEDIDLLNALPDIEKMDFSPASNPEHKSRSPAKLAKKKKVPTATLR